MAHYLSSADLQKQTGLGRRQLARLAPKIPGAVRLDEYHWRYLDSPLLKLWIKNRAMKSDRRKSKMVRSDKKARSTIVTLSLSDLTMPAERALRALTDFLETEDPVSQMTQARRESARAVLSGVGDELLKLSETLKELWG